MNEPQTIQLQGKHMNLSRVFLYSSALTIIANYAVAKYCVKLPTCEELGYIYSADKYPNNRSIKCPFDTKKILLLDYCQAYGLTSCDSTSGECDECIVEKADGTKSNSGYWRYTRCNAGYSYKSGECPPTEVDTSKYPFTQGELNEEIGEVECVQSAQNVYCGYKSCNEGWDINSGNCIVHDCGSAYPYTSCDVNGTCEECKSGFNMKYSAVTCNSGYYNIDNKCHLPCTVSGACKVGDIYAYNNTPIGVVFYNDSSTTKIIALTAIDKDGMASEGVTVYWSNGAANQVEYSTGVLQTEDTSLAKNDMNGKYNTDKILAYIASTGRNAEATTATSLYAPNVCGTGSVCAKGKWYLPAAGELVIIAQNNQAIKEATLSAGGNFLVSNYYWSSTEHGIYGGWCVNLGSAHLTWDTRNGLYKVVRPALQISR